MNNKRHVRNTCTVCNSEPFTNKFTHHSVNLPSSECACSSSEDTIGIWGFVRRSAANSLMIQRRLASFTMNSLSYWYKVTCLDTKSFLLQLHTTFAGITLHLPLPGEASCERRWGACPIGLGSSYRRCHSSDVWWSWSRVTRINGCKIWTNKMFPFFMWMNVSYYLALPYFIRSANSSLLGTVWVPLRCCFKLE